MLRISIAAIFILIITHSSQAQKTIELNEVTISATLSPQQISKTGRNIVVISQDIIKKMPANSIDEIIRYLPGIEVQSRGPMGTQSNITIRGGTFQQVLIILDGIRLNDPLTGHFNSYIPVTPDEIDRIEILKGPAAVLYGTEAVGGVVHIITKSFAGKLNNQPRTSTRDGHRLMAQIASGEYGLTNAQASGSFQKNKTNGSVSLITNNAGGQQLRGARGYFNLTTLNASLRQEIGKSWSIAYRFGLDDRTFNAQNFYTARLSDTATEYVSSTWNHIKTTYQKNQHSLTLDLGDKRTTDEYRFNKNLNPNLNKSRLQQAQLIYQYKLSEQTTVSAGTQYIRRSIVSNDRGNHAVQNAAGFAFVQTLIAKKINLLPGFRAEWNERSGWVVLPQLNMSYPYKKFNFRAAAGQTARDADFTERFNNYQRNPVPSGNRIGNPELMAEKAFSYEIGTDYSLNQHFKAAASVFGRNHNDLIDWVRTPYAKMPRQVNLVSTGNYDLASNIATVQTIGIELDLHYQKTYGDHKVNAGAGMIWMESNSSDTIPSLYVSNHARLLMNFYVAYRYKWFGISLNGLHKERNTPPAISGLVPLSASYTLINAKADVNLLKDKLSVFVQADNLFNQKYADILGSIMPSRWLSGGIKFIMD
jgi:iron complex outermembrane receptor protein